MKALARYLKPYWMFVLLAPLFMIIEVSMDLFQPRLMAKIIDEGVMVGDLALVQKTGLHMLLIAVIGLLGGIGCTIFASYASVYFATDLREDVYKKVQQFTFTQLDRFSAGQLVTRLTNDMTQLQRFVEMVLKIFVRAPLLTIGSIFMVIMISPKLALVLMATIPLIMITMFVFVRFAFPVFGKVQGRLDEVNHVMQENLRGIRLVKVFVRSTFENKKFQKENDDYAHFAIKAFRIMAINMPIMMLIMNVTIVMVLWFGAGQTWAGTLPVGELVAFINYVTQILFSLLMVGMLMMAVSRAKASADRVNEVLAVKNDRETMQLQAIPHIEGHVHFENVSFAYEKDGAEVLKNIDFDVEKGKTLAILGASGSGKTSLMQLIPGLYEADEGTITIDGMDVKNMPFAELRKHIGYVMQESLLFSGTVHENIAFGNPEASRKEVVEAAKAAQAHEFIEKMPHNYDTMIGQQGVNLSGGQKQRIAIARALLLDPAILMMDDSTSAVDTKTERLIQRALQNDWQDCTKIVIAQRISSVTNADHIIVLDDGKIVAEGRHETLLENSGIYQEIYTSQNEKEDVFYA